MRLDLIRGAKYHDKIMIVILDNYFNMIVPLIFVFYYLTRVDHAGHW